MSGVHHTLYGIPAAGNTINITWPPGDGTDFTTVYGTHTIYAGSAPPAVGSLQVTNTSGSDSAFTYVTALSAVINDSVFSALSTQLVGSPLLQGLFLRGVLNATPTVLDSGWRFDLSTGQLRLIRFDPGSHSTIDFFNLASASPTYDHYISTAFDVSFNMSASGGTVEGWLSAPGQPDTPHVKTTTASSSETGRIGMVSFYNVAGAGGPNYWGTFSATWSL